MIKGNVISNKNIVRQNYKEMDDLRAEKRLLETELSNMKMLLKEVCVLCVRARPYVCALCIAHGRMCLLARVCCVYARCVRVVHECVRACVCTACIVRTSV